MEINAIGVKNYVIWPRGGSGLTGLRPEGCGIAHGATAWPGFIGFIGFALWANGGRG